MKYCVAGFSHCGTHSLVKYLQNQGHDVTHWDTLYSKHYSYVRLCRALEGGRKPIFITRDEELGRRLRITDFQTYVDKFAQFKPEVVRLEEMTLKADFPVLNVRIQTLKKIREKTTANEVPTLDGNQEGT